MKPKCIEAVNLAARAAGRRDLTPSQIRAIDERMGAVAQRLATADTAKWRSMTPEARTLAAAQQAMADIRAEAARKVENAQRQIIKAVETDSRVTRLGELYGSGRNAALVRDMENSGHYIDGVKTEAVSGLVDLLEAGKSGQGVGLGRRALMVLFDAENPGMSRDLAVEIFANGKGGTGNTIAQKAAQAWLETIEGMRTRFNAAGGEVRKLDYGYLPQPHDSARVLAAGRDPWAAKMLPLLDRSRYLNEDGTRMADSQVTDLLRRAWETIGTDGLNKLVPGEFHGTGARANRGNDSRQIHFKDADAYLEYMAEYGQGSMYDGMISHIGGIARDIGLVERYGPNPEQQMRVQLDTAKVADQGTKRSFGILPESYWSVLTGKTATPQSASISRIGQDLRNIQTAAKLGGAVISSVTDLGTYFVTTGYNKLGYWQALSNIGKQASPETREFLTMHGVIADSMLSDMNRWAGEHVSRNWSGRLANSTMKLSFMNAWTDTLRNGFQMSMMQGLAKLSRTDWAGMSEFDRIRMERHGITADDWAVISQAKLTQHKGMEFLTPESIATTDINTARPADLQRVRDLVQEQTAELSARNAQDQAWISGRIDKFDAARDALNKAVKSRLDKKLKGNEKATEPLLQRMVLLDAQRERAKLEGDIEAQFNKLHTQDEIRSFLNAVEDGASADRVDVEQAKPAARAGLESAEAIGRRYGEQKGKLQQRMREAEAKIAAMDKEAFRAADKEGKAAQAKADAMAQDLAAYIERSQTRQKARQQVIQRIQAQEKPRLDAEAARIKNEVIAKVLGMVKDESEFAVINPDMTTKAIQTWGGQQSGTVSGELARSVMQFKSFPVAMISRHWRRMLDAPKVEGAPLMANRLAYGSAMAVTLTLLGAVAFEAKQVLQGKDPVAMDTPKFWSRAALQGGAMGILGDLLLQDPSEAPGDAGANAVKNIAGPTIGAAFELAFKIGAENIWEASKGKTTHAAAEALRFLKSNTPLINLWYAKSAIDHALLQHLQESLSPGYLARMRDRARKEWGQDYWWSPGDDFPDRAPDISTIGGKP